MEDRVLTHCLPTSLNAVEFVAILVSYWCVQVRILDIVLLSRHTDLDRKVSIHEEAACVVRLSRILIPGFVELLDDPMGIYTKTIVIREFAAFLTLVVNLPPRTANT